MYLSQVYDDADCIRKVDAQGIITTIAGTGMVGFTGEGLPPTMAQVDHPRILAIDPEGYVYVPDSRNHRVRKISIGDRYTEENIYVEPSGIAHKFSDTGLHFQTFDLDSGVVLMEFEHDSGHLEKLLFCPISLSQ